ncbi:MAG: NAD/NADP-dependent betaine aldehyde dehydrogenase [Bacteroidetes bacterium ADurb.BinA245]|jgi:acyl-CoA reductase-like NAD-dependent aldehyde dehydrogenase|nr:aldehyde dehydrogenase family protein [Chitinophagaceae bacterium]OPZ15867.1 MAG: NAD/NADP-dependent betaine aldehyde dehydrogenase [Bacteroidetes bacterium ADurb.BinA245]HNA95997.1 aldehyde dehydrogenase family protein [Chitinophagaceae bacterium]HND95453.1 aldehyde dehydrogenase family protein [Chitinophagaceae bacterium]HNJ25533.1 aldehyde dehydrogenase family protein [Chitinophagaceae bacterium]
MDTTVKKSTLSISENGIEKKSSEKRLEVLKTYKIYIGGQFPRTESGRYYQPENASGKKMGNLCLSSRKDFRDAVVSARGAFGSWSTRAAFNRGQILYRMAEMLEGRKAQFVDELIQQGSSKAKAEKEVNQSIDRLIYYAGWCDKFQQIYSAVNPVASSHFNFSVPEPMGVVAIVAPQADSLLGLVSVIAPVIAGGNTCVVLASETKPLCAVTFAEVLNSSDLPGGVVNILTGKTKELNEWFVNHMDVNATVYCENDSTVKAMMREKSALNLKRIFFYDQIKWETESGQSPYFIIDTQEIKTTWHPVENIAGAGSGY